MKYSISKRQLDKMTFCFDGKTFYGVLQHWYPLFWQRLSGCGPCCATNMLACIDDNTKLNTKQDCIDTMQKVWKFVTPGIRGLNKVEKFAKGSNGFFAKYNLPYTCQFVKCQPQNKNDFDNMIDFLKKSFANDQPVAFLNLCNGEINELERWHWVTIVSIEQKDGEYIATIFDSDLIFEMSLDKWHRTATETASFACYTHLQSVQ